MYFLIYFIFNMKNLQLKSPGLVLLFSLLSRMCSLVWRGYHYLLCGAGPRFFTVSFDSCQSQAFVSFTPWTVELSLLLFNEDMSQQRFEPSTSTSKANALTLSHPYSLSCGIFFLIVKIYIYISLTGQQFTCHACMEVHQRNGRR